jgi:hypothetical protein
MVSMTNVFWVMCFVVSLYNLWFIDHLVLGGWTIFDLALIGYSGYQLSFVVWSRL